MHPLISCICITNNRTELLLRAIVCFDAQSYPNRELVISYPKSDGNTKALINQILSISELRILPVERDEHLSIGTAKNQAIAQSKGEYICLWDDDDWYQIKRLAHQFNNMKTLFSFREACVLTQILSYDSIKQEAYHIYNYNFAGTLLCKKEILSEHPFLDTSIGEDAAIIQYLKSNHYLHYINDSSFLYIFVYHGKNEMDYFQYSYFNK